ncbi:MAG: branched-chain amino acid ABC transporter permease, partial [Pseudomonadota bacterium]
MTPTTSRAHEILIWLRTPAILIAALAVIVLLASLGPGSIQRTVVDTLIKLIVVAGLYLFIGNTGVISFGHTA